MLTSLLSLFYVAGEFHSFLHRGRAQETKRSRIRARILAGLKPMLRSMLCINEGMVPEDDPKWKPLYIEGRNENGYPT